MNVHHLICADGNMYDQTDEDFIFTNSEFIEFLRNMTKADDWFDGRKARWDSRIDPPFAHIFTKLGRAFTFNIIETDKMFNFPEVSEDLRYEFNETSLATPWSASADVKSGLQITLKRNQNDSDYENSKQCHYRNFIIHDPFEQPMTTDRLIFDYGMSLDVLISVDVVESDENLRDIDVSKRNCYFKDERKLKFFKVYTKLNCERECRSLLTYEACGCVPF